MFRKSKKPFLFLELLFVAFLCGLASCKKPDLILPPSQSSKFGIYLTDSQNNFQAVDIDIEQIFIHVANNVSGQSGWIEIPMTRQGVYNLSSFQNGVDTLIAQSNVPPGVISQIRLTLGGNNSLVLNNGVTFPLQMPASLSTGLQINLQDTLFAGKPFSLDVDFNAAASVSGPDVNGSYFFQPVITVFPKSSNNFIKGATLF